MQRPIPSTGEMLPIVGCGTYRGFDVAENDGRTADLDEVIELLLDTGKAMIDSSPMYGRAEGMTGSLLENSGRRTGAFLASKVWTRGKRHGIRQMERSLRLLRTDHVDLMQVHNLVDVETHLPTLRRWKDEGHTRYIGVTHCHHAAFPWLERILKHEPIDFIQFNYSLEDRAAEERLLPLAMDRGVAVIANMPLGGGSLVRRLLRKPLPGFSAEIGCRSWSQILLKFVLGHRGVTCTIPGTSNARHMAENLAAPGSGLDIARSTILSWWHDQ
jgi:diketogulonate reductase-like aldo/keto reductase